jgi:hypothetical protein
VYSEPSYRTGARSSYGRSWGGRRYRYGYRSGRYRAPPSPRSQRISLLIVGIPTLGFLWLVGAVIHWVGFFRARRANRERVVLVPLRRWAIVFTVLTALAILLWVAGVIGANDHPRSAPLPPPVSLTRSLGQSATLVEPVAPKADSAEVPVTVTFGNFVYPTTLRDQVASGSAPADTATGLLKVCATTKAVDPMGVVFSLSAQASGDFANADFFTAFQTPLRNTLRPGRCVSGVVGFPVPRGQPVQAVQFGVNNMVAWTVPAGQKAGEPTTT